MPTIKDHMTYIAICGSRSGSYVRERNLAETDRKLIVADIASGEIEDMVQVLEINPVEGTCRDVTEDIARDVMTVWANEGPSLSDWQFEFVEMHVSMQAALSFRREAA